MQKLSDFISEMDTVNYDGKEIYRNLLTQPEAVAVIDKYKDEINMSKLAEFTSSLNEYTIGVRLCHNCASLTQCRQPIRGHHPVLTPKSGRLHLSFAECSYFISNKHLDLIESFHMPKSMIGANFEKMHSDASREQIFSLGLDFVLNYSKDSYKKGLFLYGSMGTGKTYAICAIANELAKRGIGCAVVYFPELIAKIKEGFNQEAQQSNISLEKLKNVPVLMLDDIGSESVTSWMRDEILGRILNHRMMHELPTFFTSNFNYEQLQTHYTQTTRNEYEPVKAARILERIKALSIPVELVGRNYRNEI